MSVESISNPGSYNDFAEAHPEVLPEDRVAAYTEALDDNYRNVKGMLPKITMPKIVAVEEAA